ncbi:signal peptidase I [candidate division KSB1 bacterium]
MYNKTGSIWQIMPILAIFVIGWLAGSMFSNYSNIGLEKPLSIGVLLGFSPEIDSPADHISEKEIHVFDDKVVIDIEDAHWASFTDTNSMDPFIDSGANSIEIKPENADKIEVGDVISFSTEFEEGIIIHRVVGIEEDGQGRYFITKGDNNPSVDPGKVRFGDVHGLVVAVVY